MSVGGKKRTVTFGSAAFSVVPGRATVVTIRIAKANRALLKRLKRVKVNATLVVRDRVGNAATTVTRGVLKAPK